MNDWQQRRKQFYTEIRSRIRTVVSPTGTGLIPELSAPWREPIWILPALLSGGKSDQELAQRMIVSYWNTEPTSVVGIAEKSGKDFGIFQSTCLATLLKRYGDRLCAESRQVAAEHARHCARRHNGAAQCDYKFHGSNDNMPMMAAAGLILGGEAIHDDTAIQHGRWNLFEFRRQLFHTGWASEFNSSTYSPITLSCAAKIADSSDSPELRSAAREIESRLWTELALHFHPGTRMQSGPQSRCYAVDALGHTHSLQALWWLLLGEEVSGRDPIQTLWNHDGAEILHFAGSPWSNAAEWCSVFDADFLFPDYLRAHMIDRPYPVRTTGTAEGMDQYEFCAGEFHTTCYMERDFSLGSLNAPMYAGEQTPPFLITCRLNNNRTDFRGATTIYPIFLTDDQPLFQPEGENGLRFRPNHGWFYTVQRDNTVLMLGTPALPEQELVTDTLKLAVVFPMFYDDALEYKEEDGLFRIRRGRVNIQLQPLIPENGGRTWRWRQERNVRLLEFLHYSGPVRRFTRAELATCLSGLLLTVTAHVSSNSAVEAPASAALITDYFSQRHRFVTVQNDDMELDVILTTDPVGVQRCLIDGRSIEHSRLQSSLLSDDALPLTNGPVPRRVPFFPWEDLNVREYHNKWLIGSRGIPGEKNYASPIGNV